MLLLALGRISVWEQSPAFLPLLGWGLRHGCLPLELSCRSVWRTHSLDLWGCRKEEDQATGNCVESILPRRGRSGKESRGPSDPVPHSRSDVCVGARGSKTSSPRTPTRSSIVEGGGGRERLQVLPGMERAGDGMKRGSWDSEPQTQVLFQRACDVQERGGWGESGFRKSWMGSSLQRGRPVLLSER